MHVTKNNTVPVTPCLRHINPSVMDNTNLLVPIILPVHSGPGLSGRHINIDKVDYDLISNWLKWCGEHHQLCTSKESASIPGFKMINVDKMSLVPFDSLPSPYVTLSYVWGSFVDGPPGITGLPKVLPQAVNDAICVTKRLGFRYLWVDRYCILQDDPEIKRDQILRMGEIYSESQLTIIAAAGKDSTYGLPGVSRPRISQPSVRLGGLCMIAHSCINEEIQDSVWNSRGWTLQEGLLAKRRLVFTDTQCYMQCQEVHYHEDIRSPREFRPARTSYSTLFKPSFTYPKKKIDRLLFSTWINDFLNRNISYDEDAINCIEGLFRMSQDIELLCGLPIEQDRPTQLEALARALLWYNTAELVRRPGFPSWTWAGWKRGKTGQRIVHRQLDDGWVSISPQANFLAFPRGADRGLDDCLLHGARAHFDDGTVLDWDSANGAIQILAKSRLNLSPTFLELSGWLFDVEMIFVPLREDDPTKGEWVLSSPPPLLSKKAKRLPEHIRLAAAKEDLVGLILMSRFPGLETRTQITTISDLRKIAFLLLKRTGVRFESVERCVNSILDATEENMTLDRATGEVEIPGMELRRGTVRLV